MVAGARAGGRRDTARVTEHRDHRRRSLDLSVPLDAVAFSPGTPPGPDGELPPHTTRCMVCGPDAPAGFHLHPRREGDQVVAEFTFTEAHQGAPALAHGGAVAAVCDDLLGHVLRLVGAAAVTRRLEVEYLRPVVLGEPHRLAARLDSQEGRKLWISGEAVGEDGRKRFTASGLFVRVGLEHFLAGLPPQERARAQAALAAARRDAGDVTAW
jgi:acyl-coenzyme A thioesterase PaaI-like protein